MISARVTGSIAFVAAFASVSAAHDLFFRPDSHFAAPGAQIVVSVLNGTFSKSENGITRDRLKDLAMVGPSGRRPIDPRSWTEDDPRSSLTVTTGGEGTYVIGAAIFPRILSLTGDEFNAYLKEEGLDHVMEHRRALGKLAEPSRERYSKYMKTLLQVGETRTGNYAFVFGHEAEIVPLSNPFAARVGETLRFRCLVKGRPIAAYPVLAGGRAPVKADVRLPERQMETDSDGVVQLKLTSAGQWYVKFVHMTEIEEPDANYESRWASLSFEIR